MFITRRKFLQTSSVATLFAIVPLKCALGQSWKDRDGNPGNGDSPAGVLANYSKATFETYLNSIFQLQIAAGIIEVTLVEVADMPAPKGGECFTLLFRGGEFNNHQATYTLVHASLGTFQLLMVPARWDQEGAQGYLATINRLSLAEEVNKTAPTKRSGSTQAESPNSTPATPRSATSSVSTPQAETPAGSGTKANRGLAGRIRASWKSGNLQIF